MTFTPDQKIQIIKSLAKIEQKVERLPDIIENVEKNTQHRNRINGALLVVTFLIPIYFKFFHKEKTEELKKPSTSTSKNIN